MPAGRGAGAARRRTGNGRGTGAATIDTIHRRHPRRARRRWRLSADRHHAARCPHRIDTAPGQSGARHHRRRQRRAGRDRDCPHWCSTMPPWRSGSRTLPAVAPTVRRHPEHCAYVIFTSGSTGEPKGVIGTNAAVLGYFADHRERVYVRPCAVGPPAADRTRMVVELRRVVAADGRPARRSCPAPLRRRGDGATRIGWWRAWPPSTST